MDFFYDSQTRRYLLQFMKIFSDIKVRNGPDVNGIYTLTRVPIIYGDPSWMVAQTIKGASENTSLPAPMFSAYIDSIKMSPERRQDTQFVGKVSTMEREFNQNTQTYGSGPGIRYDVDRYMPVPYDMYIKLDCWTTSTTNKLQLFEQIGTIFNPSIQLQQNSNLLDWSSIFEVWMEEFTFTNRSIPQGGEIDRDVMSWKFKVPIWINPPAKVKRSTLVTEIVTNVFSTADTSALQETLDNRNSMMSDIFKSTPVQIITTDSNYKISVSNTNGIDEIVLLNENGGLESAQSWARLIHAYGEVEPGVTKIRLKLDPDIEISDHDIIGSISYSDKQNTLVFVPDTDTLPITTMLPIISIVDPNETSPGNGLPMSAAGQRYLLTTKTQTDNTEVSPMEIMSGLWGDSLVVYPNDIIEYNGTSWKVSFDSTNTNGVNYVFNNANNSQYMFDGTFWAYSYYGVYSPGYWRLDDISPTSRDNVA